MLTTLEPKTGGWILVAGPRSLNGALLALTARLAEGGPVRVLDGGNRFNAYPVARAAQGRPPVLDRITVSRAFTCHQVLSLLENTPACSAHFLVLDLLRTFYDEAVHFGERRRLLGECILHLQRLARQAGGLVSVHPPAVPSPAAVTMLNLLQEAAGDVHMIDVEAHQPQVLRLF